MSYYSSGLNRFEAKRKKAIFFVHLIKVYKLVVVFLLGTRHFLGHWLD